MKLIDDNIIDKTLERLDTIEEEFEKAFDDFTKKQPVVFGFLDKENTSILSDDESEYLEYLALVIYKSIENAYRNVPELTEEQLGEAEEINWEIMENAKGATFTDKITVFFDDYPQEDLLAFVEDSLTEDPDDEEANMDFVTEEGREPMFVVLKSVIDAFHKVLK